MKKRRWNSQKKLEIVMVGLSKTLSISDLCAHYAISQSQYYKWREQLLSRGNRVFDAEPDKRTQQLENKVKELTGLVGQLTTLMLHQSLQLKNKMLTVVGIMF